MTRPRKHAAWKEGAVYRIAHLSDLHLGARHPHARTRHVLKLIDRAIDAGADHLLLGGDLVDTADVEDLAPLLAHLDRRGYLRADRLSVVPGNHDVWPFSAEQFSQLTAGAESLGRVLIENIFAKLRGNEWPAQERYEAFIDAFEPTFENAETLYDDDPFPCVKQVGPVSLALLDTTSDLGLHRSAQGRFDEDEGAFLVKTLAKIDGPRILLMHHLPEHAEFDDSEYEEKLPSPVRRLLEAMDVELSDLLDKNFEDLRSVRSFIRRARFDAVFCGHIHVMGDDPRGDDFDTKIGRVPIHCMGRSGAVDQDADDAMYGFHLIEADRGVQVTTTLVPPKQLDRNQEG